MVLRNGKFAQDRKRRATQLMKWILIHFRGRLDEQLRPQGVTTSQLSLLHAIRESPGSSGARLARCCHITPQTAQSLIERAEESGWIVRGKDPKNDRIVTCSLTASGRQLLKKGEIAARKLEETLWEGVPHDVIDNLNEILEQCIKNIDTV